MSTAPASAIVHNVAASRFETAVEGHIAIVAYAVRDGVMVMPHTAVPHSIGGRGIGARLVAAAMAHARAHGLKVDPQCSYVAAYMRRHPEVQDLHV